MSRTHTLLLIAAFVTSLISLAVSAYALVQLDRTADETARLATVISQIGSLRTTQESNALRRPPPTIDTSED